MNQIGELRDSFTLDTTAFKEGMERADRQLKAITLKVKPLVYHGRVGWIEALYEAPMIGEGI
jgi:hypothetical protein